MYIKWEKMYSSYVSLVKRNPSVLLINSPHLINLIAIIGSVDHLC